MQKENFIELLNRSSPKELMDIINTRGKGPKPICPITFFDEIEPEKVDTNIENYKNARIVE